MKGRKLLIATAMLLAASIAGAAGGEGAYSIRIEGRGFDERCLRLDAGESIRYRFSASAPVKFNIHYHRGKEVFYPVRAAGRAADSSFTAPHADTYCLMWEHAADGAVTVDGMLDRVAR